MITPSGSVSKTTLASLLHINNLQPIIMFLISHRSLRTREVGYGLRDFPSERRKLIE